MAGFIAAQRADHGIPQAVSCRALDVSESWFYKWQRGDESPQRARRERLKAEVRRLFEGHRGKRGSPMLTADLRDLGWQVSKNTVAAVMAGMGLAARPKKRRRGATRPGKGRWRAPDLVRRDFGAAAINRKWYADGTEIPTDEGKLYLDSVLDMGSRRILGFALGEHHDAELAYGALAMAVAVRGGRVSGVIMHTDQGSEHTAGAFRAACERLSICQSMGRPGSALDNAVIESWHSTLEFELRRIEHFATKAAARAGVAAWIEDYNHHRRHSAHLHQAAALPAWGRAARGYGAAPPASRLLRTAARRPAAGPDPGDLCGPSGRKYGQAPACPAPGRGASGDHWSPRTSERQENEVNWRSIIRRECKITRIRYEEVSTV